MQTEEKVLFNSDWNGNEKYPKWERVYVVDKESSNQVILTMQFKMRWVSEDWHFTSYQTYLGEYENRYIPVATGGVSLVLFALVLRYMVLQVKGTEWKERMRMIAKCQEEGWSKKIPLDLVAVLWFGGFWITIYYVHCFVDEITFRYWQGWYVASLWDEAYLAIVWSICTLIFFLFLVWMVIVRKRNHTWKQGLLVLRAKELVEKGNKTIDDWIKGRLPLWVTLCLRFLAFGILEFLLVYFVNACNGDFGSWVLVFVLFHGIVLLVVARRAGCRQRIQEGAEAIAEGDLSYQINTKGMSGEQLDLAENLNRIGESMAEAVHESVKSERMKTELITNVSHDIKTPLTSIINYVDLLQKEHTPEQEKEYLEVLVRQSAKLKKLTEDVLEASKAASGNVEVHLVPLSFKEMVNQAAAEYESKLMEADLKLVWKMPEEDLNVMADGKLMWRVLDNLFGNVCKYSLKGTRVYIEVARFLDQVTMTMKNVSAEELNVSAEELTERFVRGDKSRSTEGSGLGLHIAMSFMKLQGGDMELEIDGDLFKVKLTMPVAEEIIEIIPPVV